jgi:hypothetical protein
VQLKLGHKTKLIPPVRVAMFCCAALMAKNLNKELINKAMKRFA